MDTSDPTFDTFPDLASLFPRTSASEWRAAAETSLKGRPLERLTVRTLEGLSIDPLYTAQTEVDDPGLPGQAPFVRGRTPAGSGSSGWQVCQAVVDPDPLTAAKRAAEAVNRGADALWLVVDRSVRAEIDELDEPVGDGIVIPVSTAFDPFFNAVDPATAAVHLDAGGAAPAVAACLLNAARRHEVNPHDLRGSLGVDPLGSLAADGRVTMGLTGGYSAMAELVAWSGLRAPGLRTVAVSTLPYHLAGADAVRELAFAAATAVTYLRELSDRGVPLDAAGRQLLFRFAVGRDLFIEAAKLRAFRRIWSRIGAACGFEADDRGALIHAVDAPRGMSRRDPWVNMLRTTVGAFAAAVGGADIITVLPFDSAFGPPGGLGRRMAVNTQTILREESQLARVIDPGGGSWYIESLTDRLAAAAWERFQSIERDGGMAESLCTGAVASELEKLQRDRDQAIATRRAPITGVSSYPNLDEATIELEPPTQPVAVEVAQASEQLARLFSAANDPKGDGSLVELAMDAAGSGAAVARIADAWRGTRDSVTMPPLPAHREAEVYERLRDASDAWLEAHGTRPRIFLANMGAIPEHKPRATFAKSFFEAGGIETVGNDGFDSVSEAVAAFAQAETAMAVICSSDQRYPEVVPELAAALDAAGARTVLVAGTPGEHEDAWRAAGVTGFVYIGADQVSTLIDLLREEGVLHV